MAVQCLNKIFTTVFYIFELQQLTTQNNKYIWLELAYEMKGDGSFLKFIK